MMVYNDCRKSKAGNYIYLSIHININNGSFTVQDNNLKRVYYGYTQKQALKMFKHERAVLKRGVTA